MALQCTRSLVLALALLMQEAFAFAAPIRICTPDIAFPPFMYPDGEGTIQWLIRTAAQRTNIRIRMEPMPVKRCMAEMITGGMHARVAAFSDFNRTNLRFPLKGNGADTDRAVGYGKEVVYRLKGNKADWDGERFSNLDGAVLIQPGFPATEQLLASLRVPVDSGGRTLEVNLGKLLVGRGSVAIGFEFHAQVLFAKPEFAGKFEILPVPIRESHYFLAFTYDYYQAHATDIERLWTAIGEQKHQPEYEALKQRRVNEAIHDAKRL